MNLRNQRPRRKTVKQKEAAFSKSGGNGALTRPSSFGSRSARSATARKKYREASPSPAMALNRDQQPQAWLFATLCNATFQ